MRKTKEILLQELETAYQHSMLVDYTLLTCRDKATSEISIKLSSNTKHNTMVRLKEHIESNYQVKWIQVYFAENRIAIKCD